MAVVNSRSSPVRNQTQRTPPPTGNPALDEHLQYLQNAVANNSDTANQNTYAVVFDTAVSAGQTVALYNNAGALTATLADSSNNTKLCRGFLITTPGVVAGKTGLVQFSGINSFLSGLTPGETYYQDTVPGGVSDIQPSSAGTVVQSIGFSLSATELMFLPSLDFVQN